MGFERVRHYNFRNLRDATTDLSAPQVFLLGENGQGKSNFLESLYLLSYGAGFRSRRDADMVRIGTEEMAVDGDVSSNGSMRRIFVTVNRDRKQIRIDGETVKDRRDMIDVVPTVLFRHSDMDFVQGSPDLQRWFIDQTLSMSDVLYVDDLRRYRRVLRNRNEALKRSEVELLAIYDYELAEIGVALTARREAVIREFDEVFLEEYRAIAGLPDDVSIAYRPSWNVDLTVENVLSHLADRRINDLDQRTSTSGPHRDRIMFRYQDGDFVKIASTGQIRLVSLILRVAQARFYGAIRGKLPVLLLDDVLLELDPVRRERFVERLPPAEQRVFTFLPGEAYDAYRDNSTLVYYVEDGAIRGEAGS